MPRFKLIVAKDQEKTATSEWKKCRNATIACNKMEDKTVSYISSCKTGSSALKTKLVSLYKASDYVTKSKSKSSSATSSSSSRAISRVTLTYTAFTINTSDTSAISNSSFFVNCVSWLVLASEEFSSDVDDMGDNTTIRLIILKIVSLLSS